MKVAVALSVVLVCVGLISACGGDSAKGCDSSNCAGCCQDGVCVTGDELSACGLQGVECALCIGGQDCTDGDCVASSSTCGAGNCQGGCCEGNNCMAGIADSGCGTGGGACKTCAQNESCISQTCQAAQALCASNCQGCCQGNTCVAGNLNDACGASGAACKSCDAGQSCSNGTCLCSPDCIGKECGAYDGCGGYCATGTCASAGFSCVDGQCKAGATSLWIVKVTSGTITETGPDGSSWDALGGAPDPYVCLTIGSQPQACTVAKDDTLHPTWNKAFPAATTAAIQSGIVVSIWDEDVSSNDPIYGAGTIVPSDGDLASGYGSVACDYASVNLTITPLY